MILKIKSDLKNQIEENINVHKNIFNISEDIIEVIENIYKKLKVDIIVLEKTSVKNRINEIHKIIDN